jgi:hypothetical protein
MDGVYLAWLAVAVLGLGSAATVLLTRWIPQPVAALAAQHGRFAGLGEQDGSAMPAPPAGAHAGTQAGAHTVARVQPEAMDVVRTSN